MKKYSFSVIIPVRVITPYLKETLNHLKSQEYKNFEVIVIDDKISKSPNPAYKRNLGAKKSTSDYLAFIDDDSYPDKHWLKNINHQINLHPEYSAFCGPCLTPPQDSILQQASGLVWSSYLGSGGAGTYRNYPSKPRFVDDYPTVNLVINRNDFQKIGGFQTQYWPGEDTLLCLDIIKKLKKKIYYHPSIMVYHHRRNVLIPHLKQMSRYALHRGLFARLYPQTSFRLGYLFPSLFFIYFLIIFLYHKSYILYPLYLYLSLLVTTFLSFLLDKRPFTTSLLATITIPLTHLYYGFLFIIGYLSPNLRFRPHKIDKIKNQYVGG